MGLLLTEDEANHPEPLRLLIGIQIDWHLRTATHAYKQESYQPRSGEPMFVSERFVQLPSNTHFRDQAERPAMFSPNL
jgi:hypothetical protein